MYSALLAESISADITPAYILSYVHCIVAASNLPAEQYTYTVLLKVHNFSFIEI